MANFRSIWLRIMAMVKKEFKLFNSDKFNRFIAIFLPPLVILAFSLQCRWAEPVRTVNILVITMDSDPIYTENSNATDMFEEQLNITSKAIIDNYSIPYISIVNQTQGARLITWINGTENPHAMITAREYMANYTIEAIVVLPSSFSELILTGYPGVMQCLVDASDIMRIQTILNVIQGTLKLFEDTNGLTPSIQINTTYNFAIPEDSKLPQIHTNNSVINNLINLNDPEKIAMFNSRIVRTLPFILFGISMILTILVVVQERPIARLLLTPISRIELLCSKYITYTILLIVQIIMILIIALLNGLYIQGTMFDFFIALFFIGFTGSTIGMLISVISTTKTEANQYFFMTFIIFVLLSGMFVPLESMPSYLQILADILPLGHGAPILNSILTKGGGFSFQDTHVQALMSIVGVCFVLSFLLFLRKNYEV